MATLSGASFCAARNSARALASSGWSSALAATYTWACCRWDCTVSARISRCSSCWNFSPLPIRGKLVFNWSTSNRARGRSSTANASRMLSLYQVRNSAMPCLSDGLFGSCLISWRYSMASSTACSGLLSSSARNCCMRSCEGVIAVAVLVSGVAVCCWLLVDSGELSVGASLVMTDDGVASSGWSTLLIAGALRILYCTR